MPQGVWGTYKAVKEIMDLDVVFWGNAGGNASKPTCQHGPVECRLHSVYACSKNLYAGVDNWLPLVKCVDDTFIKTFPKGLPMGTVNMSFADASAAKCAKTIGQDWAKIDACSTSQDGIKYLADEKGKTPPHPGVPFATINGGKVQCPAPGNLIKAVCDAYTGSPKPPACSTAYPSSSSDEWPEHSFESSQCKDGSLEAFIQV